MGNPGNHIMGGGDVLSNLSLDIRTLHERYASGSFKPSDIIEEVYRRIEARGEDHVWLSLVPKVQALARARELEARVEPSAGPDTLPLYGLPFSVKDNLHVAGMPTSAACPAFAFQPEVTATAIARAVAAGAILIGKTNMDQFANGLVGVRCPTGYCRNLFNPDYIPGGSSSGAGVSVGDGLVSFAYGSDTGGSGRVPGAMSNVIGFKPTPGVISVAGFLYANRSFDVCPIFSLTVDDTYRVFEAVRGFDAADDYSRPEAAEYDVSAKPVQTFTFGVPDAESLTFFGDKLQEREFQKAIIAFQAMGGRPVTVDFKPFLETGRMLFNGPVLAERLVDLSPFIDEHPGDLHPATRAVMSNAAKFSAADAYRAQYRLQQLRRSASREFEKCDVLLVPTTATIYRIAEVEADPIRLNANNGYYTYFANLLQLAAISVPASFRPDDLPFSICLLAPALQEGLLRGIAQRFHEASGLTAGATGIPVAKLYGMQT